MLRNLIRRLLAATAAGVLLVLLVVVITLLVADVGQSTLEQATGSPAPPKSAFYDESSFKSMAPWFFLMGFGGTLLSPGPGKRQLRRRRTR